MDHNSVCRVPTCDRPIKVLKESLCGRHYARLRRHGDPEAWKKPRRLNCSVEGCMFRSVANGLCDLHYRRQRRYGTTDAPVQPTICGVAECGRTVQALGLCDRHYRRARTGAIERRCQHCGDLIDPNTHGKSAYCSREHREQALCLERRRSHRARWLKQYGLTVEQFQDLLSAQAGRCAICRTDEVPRRGSWHVDHDHETGKVRGILCHGCNVSLGHFRDDPILLRRAIEYLERAVVVSLAG